MKNNLENWVISNAEANKNDFPDSDFNKYVERLKSISSQFRNGPLKLVDQLASVKDLEFYTVHGVSHVETVLLRAADISVNWEEPIITCYEGFLLVVAIYAHDSAMIYGRKNHAINLQEVLGSIAGSSTILLEDEEKRKIISIARAHTSDQYGKRDTITSALGNKEPCGGKRIHSQKLAAILRMADQLSDDKTRSAIGKVDERSIPAKSLIYHHFLAGIDSIICELDESTVEVHFRFNARAMKDKYQFGRRKIYLLDFLIEEMMKWYREFFYCSRFTRPEIELRSLMFSLIVYDDGTSSDISSQYGYTEGVASFDFTEKRYEREFILTLDQGYPFPSTAYDICPDLTLEKGKKFDGEQLAKDLTT